MNMPIARRNFLGMAAGAALVPLSIGKAIAATPTELRIQRLGWAGVRLQTQNATLFIETWLGMQPCSSRIGIRIITTPARLHGFCSTGAPLPIRQP
jgi:hypothetical protein